MRRPAQLPARRKVTKMRARLGPSRPDGRPPTAAGVRPHMKRSTDRILTTHTGSLPRTARVVELLLAEQKNRGARRSELDAAVREAIAHVVAKQIESGVDVVNDGEQGRTDYTVHVL